MGHWNYRVMERVIDGELCHVMVEAYYRDGEQDPYGYCEVELLFDEVEGKERQPLRWTLERMLEALDKPVLKEQAFEKEE